MNHLKTGRAALTLAVLLALPGLAGAQEMVNAEAYREALQDKFANPGTMVADQGEIQYKAKRGPKNVSLEKCDFGLGAGKLKGAYAQMPRYFKDSNKVEDLESRLVTCMVKLQGFSEAEVKEKVFADNRANESNTPIEAIAMYVAAQSDGMKIAPPHCSPTVPLWPTSLWSTANFRPQSTS